MKGCRTLRIEPLEIRSLLSLTIAGYAVPDYVAYLASNSTAPFSTAGPTGYTPAQLRQAYGFDKITFNNGTVAGTGSGTTIAIVDAYDDPKIANDLHQFDLQFGLPDPVLTKVSQTGGAKLPAANAGWITEIALDVEWAHAIAPAANILLVEAASSSLSNLLTAVNYARNAAGVVAVSMSWGAGEFSGESAYDGYFTTPSGHGGVTFVASSGDSGAPAGYPAISSNVLSVGGTTLYLNGQGGYGSESGWSGSGGGISAYEPQPSYQTGVVAQSTVYRTNPDVAYDSNPATGFPVYDSYNNPASSPWGQWGGTSDAAPQWAALIAIADQGRALAGKAALDGATQTLPMLYALSAGDFHDATSGSSAGRPTYSAVAGYDLVTGRGTPYANLVVGDLVGTPQSFTLTAPITGTYQAGQTVTIQWTADGVTAGSKISLCYDTDTVWNDGNESWIEIDQVAATSGNGIFSWNTKGVAPGTYYVAGYLWNGANTFSPSHLTQSIVIQGNPATFAISAPASGTFTVGQTIPIQWTAGNVSAGSKITLCYDDDTIWNNNQHWIEIDQVVAANGPGAYLWNTAGVAPGTYYVAGYLWDGANTFTLSHLTQSITINASAALLVKASLSPHGLSALLSGAIVSQAAGSAVRIDRDAAAVSWVMDPTPGDDAEPAGGAVFSSQTPTAPKNTEAEYRADLLDAVMGEMLLPSTEPLADAQHILFQ